jgi:enterochelin esterase-like enzyme
VGSLRAQLKRFPLQAFLYGGRSDKGSRSIAPFAARLRADGAHVRTALYPGGHSWRLWRTSMTPSLLFAANHMGAR